MSTMMNQEILTHDIQSNTIPSANFERKIYGILFFLMGFVWMLPNKWTIIVFSLLVMFYIINNNIFKKHRSINCNFVFFCVFSLIILSHFALNNLFELIRFSYVPFHDVYISSCITSFLRLIFAVLYIYIFSNLFREYSQDALLIRAFVLGFNIFLSFVFVYYRNAISLSNIYGARLAFSFVDDASMIHPNTVARVMMLFFYLNLIASFYVNNIIIKTYHWLFCIINFVIILLTLARTSLYSLLVGLFFSIFFHRKICLLLFLISLLLSTYIAVFEKKISDFSFVPERITLSRMMEDQGSGRLDVWKDYLNHASLKDYAMGVGFTEDHRIILYQKPLRVKVGDDQISSVALVMFEPHSAYLLVFFSVGALGFCVYLYFLFIIFKKFLYDAIIESGVHIIYMSLFLSFITWSIAGYGFIEMLTFLSLFISKTVRFNEHYKRRS